MTGTADPVQPPACLVPDAGAEHRYEQLAPRAYRKALGQFFTPPRLAALMADWIGEGQPQRVLDPALGAGILTRAALLRCKDARLVAHETDGAILAHADLGQPERVQVRTDDFLCAGFEPYDAIIMNPPYIRHRALERYAEARARIGLKAGFVIPRTANLYVYFVVKACLQLRRGGRGAFLIPTEWMNANFSSGFKSFLLGDGGLAEIVIFSGASRIFQDALTTASVLFVEKR